MEIQDAPLPSEVLDIPEVRGWIADLMTQEEAAQAAWQALQADWQQLGEWMAEDAGLEARLAQALETDTTGQFWQRVAECQSELLAAVEEINQFGPALQYMNPLIVSGAVLGTATVPLAVSMVGEGGYGPLAWVLGVCGGISALLGAGQAPLEAMLELRPLTQRANQAAGQLVDMRNQLEAARGAVADTRAEQ